jgi:hypothetical protein
MNLLSLVGPRLDNICQIRRKWYYSSSSKNLQSKRGLEPIRFAEKSWLKVRFTNLLREKNIVPAEKKKTN